MPIKKITLYVAVAALFLIPIFPLIVANSFFFPFITGKAFYFRILVEIAFAAWAILAFIEPKYRPRITPLTIGVTLFALVALVADLLGVNPIRSLWSNFERMEGWITIIHLWAFYIVATCLFSPTEIGKIGSVGQSSGANGAVIESGSQKLWHRWVNVSLLVAFVVSLYGLVQLFGWAPTHQGAGRVDASLGNSAYMAVYMLFSAFLAAYMFFIARAKKIINAGFLQWVYAILAILFTFILFETQTRGTILGVIGGIMLACAVYAVFGKNEPAKRRWVSGGIIALIVLLGLVFWANRHNPAIERNPILGRFSNVSWSDASNQARQYIWPMAINGAMHRPLFGWGQENFNYIFNADYNPLMYSQEQWFDRAHNVFLDWLVNSGIVGLIAYLSLYVLFLYVVWKSSLGIAEKSVLTGLLAGYFVHNIFVFDNLASYVLFFAVLGFANSLPKREIVQGQVSMSSPNWFGMNPVRMDAVEYIVAPIAIVLLIGAVYFYNVRPIQANTRLISALQACGGQSADTAAFQNTLNVNTYVANQEIREQLLSCAGGVLSNQQAAGPTKQAFFTLANKEIQVQIAATPKDARIYVLGGAFYDSIGQYVQAASLLEEGHRLSPGKQTLDFELATALINTGKSPEAEALLKQAYESAPDYFQAKNAYAITMVLDGKEAQARQMFNNDPAIFDTQQMAGIYASQKQYAKAITIFQNLASSSPTDVNIQGQLAQLQFTAGMKSASIKTLQGILKNHPELKDQIDAAIKQAQSGK